MVTYMRGERRKYTSTQLSGVCSSDFTLMFRRFDGGDSICTSQGCSRLVGSGRVEREEQNRKGGTKWIKMEK
jgi:hypothetical protein